MQTETEYFDAQKEGNEWFYGKKKGWLVISRRNIEKIRVGDYGVFRAGGAELAGTITKVWPLETQGALYGQYFKIEFKTDNGQVFSEKSFNLLAVKLRKGL